MITYFRGDLTEATEPVIIHGCNSHGVMGSGVALAIKKKWPAAYNEYNDMAKIRQYSLTLGTIIPVRVDSNKWVINAITQKDYGKDGKKYVSYDAIDEVMSKILIFCNQHGYSKIAMPKIGAGLGGGNWNVIETIIAQGVGTYIDVKIYEL